MWVKLVAKLTWTCQFCDTMKYSFFFNEMVNACFISVRVDRKQRQSLTTLFFFYTFSCFAIHKKKHWRWLIDFLSVYDDWTIQNGRDIFSTDWNSQLFIYFDIDSMSFVKTGLSIYSKKQVDRRATLALEEAILDSDDRCFFNMNTSKHWNLVFLP